MNSPRQQLNNPQLSISGGIVICRAGAADLEAVVRLAEICSMAARWSPTAIMSYCAAEEPGNMLQAKTIFVACTPTESLASPPASGSGAQSRNIVGFAAFSAITGASPGECALENLAVAEAWRRQGVGARLLAAGLLWCRAQPGSTLWLEVRPSSLAAIALYERVGFTLSGRRPGYYTGPEEDAIVMRKILGDAAAVPGC